ARSASGGRRAPARPEPKEGNGDRRLVFRFRVAILVSAMRAIAAACGFDKAAPGPVRRDSRSERPAGTGGNRGEAPLYVSLRRLAGESARHSAPISARASVQSIAAAAARDRMRQPDRGDRADLPLRLA